MLFQYYVGVALVLVLFNSELISAATEDAGSKILRDYDRRVCKNEPSCDLTNSVQKDRLTLKKRDCMCDFECSEYDDCCQDSQYLNAARSERKYYCHPYSEVYVVINCASDYQNRTVIAKCEKGVQPLEENDFDLIIPVTNVGKRVTYANRYCALCNNDQEYESWDFYAGCGEPADEERPISSPSFQNNPTKSGSTMPAPRRTSQSTSTPRTRQNGGKKYESSTKSNIIPDDYIGSGCRSPSSPCRDDYKPSTTQAPNYEYHKPAPKTDYWAGDSRNGMLNIRIEIGGRFKRQQGTSVGGGSRKINYKKYEAVIDELLARARYDVRSKNFVVTSNDGKNLVCRFNSTYPKTMEDAVRTCVLNVISECSGGNGSPCPSYTSIVYDTKSRTPYRNRECARCNGIQNDEKLTGCLTDVTRAAASKDLAKTGRKSQDTDLEKLSENPDISFS